MSEHTIEVYLDGQLQLSGKTSGDVVILEGIVTDVFGHRYRIARLPDEPVKEQYWWSIWNPWNGK